jgi:hypothetical protein
LLVELRASVVALEEEETRLRVRLQALAQEKTAARRRLPWHLRPGTGAGIATGALAGTAAEMIATGAAHPAAPFALALGCAWTLTALLRSAHASGNANRPAMLEGIRRARRQRAALERQIAQLEE